MFAPDEIPSSRPSSREGGAVAIASSNDGDHFAVTSCRGLRARSPASLSLCGPGLPPERTSEVSGSTVMIVTPGLRSLSTWPTPSPYRPFPRRDEHIDGAVGIAPDFLGRRAAMHFGLADFELPA